MSGIIKGIYAKDPTIIKKIISNYANTFENVGEMDKVLEPRHESCSFY